eukprot:366442-Chlamydomonas_euryale.AAC.20
MHPSDGRITKSHVIAHRGMFEPLHGMEVAQCKRRDLGFQFSAEHSPCQRKWCSSRHGCNAHSRLTRPSTASLSRSCRRVAARPLLATPPGTALRPWIASPTKRLQRGCLFAPASSCQRQRAAVWMPAKEKLGDAVKVPGSKLVGAPAEAPQPGSARLSEPSRSNRKDTQPVFEQHVKGLMGHRSFRGRNTVALRRARRCASLFAGFPIPVSAAPPRSSERPPLEAQSARGAGVRAMYLATRPPINLGSSTQHSTRPRPQANTEAPVAGPSRSITRRLPLLRSAKRLPWPTSCDTAWRACLRGGVTRRGRRRAASSCASARSSPTSSSR